MILSHYETLKNKYLEGYINSDNCAACGGECCRQATCLAHPRDFGETPQEIKDNLLAALESGMWIVDYWDGDCPSLDEDEIAYFVRPRSIRDACESWEYGSWGGECLFWSAEGCAIPPEARPLGGLALIPRENYKCGSDLKWGGTNDKPTFALEWSKYVDIIEEILGKNDETWERL